MFELLTQLIPEWIAKFRTPMSDPTRQYWEKMRQRGIFFYVMLWIFGLGGLLFAFDMDWGLRFEHFPTDGLFAVSYAAGCVLFALILGTVNWHVNENRYRNSKAL